jgi:hypothetical protein
MSEVAMCTENIGIADPGDGMVFKCKVLESPPEYFVQYHSHCLLLLIQPLLKNIAVLRWNCWESDLYDAVHSGHQADLSI